MHGTSGTPLQYVILSIVWVRSFIEPYLLDNNGNVQIDNTAPIYLINLLLKLGLGLDLWSCIILAFFMEYKS